MNDQRVGQAPSPAATARRDSGGRQGGVRIEVLREDVHQARAVAEPAPEPAEHQATLRIERFALSATNITYARLGDAIGYWQFYPAAPGWGCVPAWGIGRVTGSRTADVPVGSIASGLFPMASHVLMSPGRVSRSGFDEHARHRRELPRLYNVYRWVTETGLSQDQRLVLQPSFWLSFLLADYLRARDWFEADVVLISSASSKAAMGLAFLLRGSVRTVGLTSAARVRELGGLGLFDQVVGYDAAGSLARDPAVFLDLAGSTAIRDAVHDRLGGQLRHNVLAGTTHGPVDLDGVAPGPGGPVTADPGPPGPGPPGPGPPGPGPPGPGPGSRGQHFFFVPDYLRARARELGMDVLAPRFDDALAAFARHSESWLRLQYVHGADEVLAAYQRILGGSAPMSTALICSLAP
jgi:uncharacterized protein DUF2855